MVEISFKTALQITGDFERDKDIIHIIRTDTPGWKGPDVMTVKDVKDKFDLKKEKVVGIKSYFLCGDYSGYLYTLKARKIKGGTKDV